MKKSILLALILSLTASPVLAQGTFDPSSSSKKSFVDTTLKTVTASAATCVVTKTINNLVSSQKVGDTIKKAATKAFSGVAGFFTGGIADKVLEGKQEVVDEKVQELLNRLLTKEDCWDGIASNIAKTALQQITNQTVAWVNTGLDGNPTYVRDINSFLYSIRNKQLSSILPQIQENESIFGTTVRGVLTQQLTGDNKNISSLIKQTPEAVKYSEFMDDFTQEGWSGLLNSNYNPLSAFFSSVNNISGRLENVEQNTREEINRNSGFLDIKECVEQTTPSPQSKESPTCLRYATTHPGSLISSQIARIYESPVNQIEQVDEINEVIYMFFYNLLDKTFKKNSNGKSGLFYSNVGGGIEGLGGTHLGSNVIFDANGKPMFASSTGTGLSKGYSRIDISRPQEIREVVQTQRDFISATKDVLIVAADIIPELAQLDYCMPGPNPLWSTSETGSIADNFESMIEANADSWKFYNPKLFSTDEITMDEAWTNVGNLYTTAYISGFPVIDPISEQKFILDFTELTKNTIKPVITIQVPVPKEKFESTWEKIFGAFLAPGGNLALPPLGTLKAQKIDYSVIYKGRSSSNINNSTIAGTPTREANISSTTIPFFFNIRRLSQKEFEDWLKTSLNTLGRELQNTYSKDAVVEAFGTTGATPVNQVLNKGVATSAYREAAGLIPYVESYNEVIVQYDEMLTDTESLIRELEVINHEVRQIVKIAKARYIKERNDIGDPVDMACINAAYVIDESPIVGAARLERTNRDDNPKIKRVTDAREYFEKAALIDTNSITGATTRGRSTTNPDRATTNNDQTNTNQQDEPTRGRSN